MKCLASILLLVTAGCAVPVRPAHVPACGPAPVPEKKKSGLPTDADRKRMIEQADCGPVPTKEMLDAVEPILRARLRDPESLKDLAFGQPHKEMLWGDYPDTYRIVWRVPMQFRARNGFGGYNLQTGVSDYEQGKLVQLWLD